MKVDTAAPFVQTLKANPSRLREVNQDVEELETLMGDGTIAGGMALKVRVALEASAAGIPEVVIAGKARLLGQFAGTRLR